MFEHLSDRLQSIFAGLGGKARLTERDVDTAMREVRTALLEADVNLTVVRDLVTAIRERAIGQDVLASLTPAETVITIVHEELVRTLGAAATPLNKAPSGPTIVMLVGLNGAGKTTTGAKIARLLKAEGRAPLLVAADVYRPAAIMQLQTLGGQLDVPVHAEDAALGPVEIVQRALARAKTDRHDVVIVDTAGRFQIDDAMMRELEQLRDRFHPHETLLVADAMTGQEAVAVAQEFNRRVGITGLVLTKMDGDARGGAALSIRSVTDVPIKFIATGETTDAIEVYHPDRVAARILGMGDVQSLIEKAQNAISEQDAANLEKRLTDGKFDLEDFLAQMKSLRSLGPLQNLLEMIPGLGSAMRQAQAQIDERDLTRVEAIIQSMTREERRKPEIVSGRRITRIARGCGRRERDVEELLLRFRDMRKMLQQLGMMGGGKGGFGGLGNLGKLGNLAGMANPGMGFRPPVPKAPRQPSGLPTAPPTPNLSQLRHAAKKQEQATRGPASGRRKR